MKSSLIKIVILVLLLGVTGINRTNAFYSDTEVATGNTFTAGCWTPPSVPTLLSPADAYVTGQQSDWLKDPVLDWTDSTGGCAEGSVQYELEIYRDLKHKDLLFRSELLAESTYKLTGKPNDTLYWRVRAGDGSSYSDWSSEWELIIDRNPDNNSNNNSNSRRTEAATETQPVIIEETPVPTPSTVANVNYRLDSVFLSPVESEQ